MKFSFQKVLGDLDNWPFSWICFCLPTILSNPSKKITCKLTILSLQNSQMVIAEVVLAIIIRTTTAHLVIQTQVTAMFLGSMGGGEGWGSGSVQSQALQAQVNSGRHSFLPHHCGYTGLTQNRPYIISLLPTFLIISSAICPPTHHREPWRNFYS